MNVRYNTRNADFSAFNPSFPVRGYAFSVRGVRHDSFDGGNERVENV